MTGMIHAGTSLREVDGFSGVFFCRVSGLRGTVFAGVLDLAGRGCRVEAEEEFCLETRAVRLVPAGRILSRYL